MDYEIIRGKDLISTEKLHCSKCINIINAIFIFGAFTLV